MQPWVPGHKHQPESQLSLVPSTAQNRELAGQQTRRKAPLRGTRARRLLQGSETQPAEPAEGGGMELTEKSCPAPAPMPGTTVPFRARHTLPWANRCHWPGWGAGAACPALGEDTELCPAQGSHFLHSYQEKAKAARNAAPGQGCSPIPALWHIPTIPGGEGLGPHGNHAPC